MLRAAGGRITVRATVYVAALKSVRQTSNFDITLAMSPVLGGPHTHAFLRRVARPPARPPVRRSWAVITRQLDSCRPHRCETHTKIPQPQPRNEKIPQTLTKKQQIPQTITKNKIRTRFYWLVSVV